MAPFNTLIGGYFKFHWMLSDADRRQDRRSANPINAPFTVVNQPTGVRLPRPFSIVDEVYTFNEDSWSRDATRTS